MRKREQDHLVQNSQRRTENRVKAETADPSARPGWTLLWPGKLRQNTNTNIGEVEIEIGTPATPLMAYLRVKAGDRAPLDVEPGHAAGGRHAQVPHAHLRNRYFLAIGRNTQRILWSRYRESHSMFVIGKTRNGLFLVSVLNRSFLKFARSKAVNY